MSHIQSYRQRLLGKSQLGILYLSRSNNKFMKRLFAQKGIEFTPLRQFPPCVYIGHNHPLKNAGALTVEDLQDYPYIKYYQAMTPISMPKR